MTDLFTPLIYPWQQPEGVELHRLLTEIFISNDEAIEVAQKAGLQRSKLNTQKATYYLWKEILEKSSAENRLRKLAEVAKTFLHEAHTALPFFNALLANEAPPVMARSAVNHDGSPKFIASNDLVTQPEALLYYDDLTLQVGRLPALIKSLGLLQQLSPAVCHLLVDFNGAIKHGTGFRIAEDLLLTNWHVVHNDSGQPAAGITAEFGYEDDGNGGFHNTTKLPCRHDNVVAEKDNDWAVVTVNAAMNPAWPVIKLSTFMPPVLHTPAFIIQHPDGQSKRIGYVRNQVADYTDRVVHYLTDTQEGSSGAPVFNALGQLIALHRAGGRPQQIPGRPPVKKNEGVRISCILTALQQNGITVP